MTDTDQNEGTQKPATAALDEQPYDRRRLSYANTFNNPYKKFIIQAMELFTGKLTLIRLIRKFEAMGVPFGQPFWKQALGVMGIAVTTPQEQSNKIPKTGPVIITANHPHGLVDGMVLAELIGRVRTDYKILTRSLLTGVAEIDEFMIPVPFPHEEDSLNKNLEMRKEAMTHLKNGGVIVIFPSGAVSSSDTMFGPVVEKTWNPFTAKMIQRSGAEVLPIYFPGSNSRLYQMANQISPTLRQGLLIREIVHALNKPQGPIVGDLVPRETIQNWSTDPRGFMAWLRDETLKLDPKA